MLTLSIRWLALAASLLPFGAQAQDPQRGAEQFAVCAACHGPEGAGNPQLHAPPIAGLDREYLRLQLESFRDGMRGHPESPYGAQMRRIAETLDDEEMADVTAYVESLPPLLEPEPVVGDPGRGQREYLLCTACHGPEAEGQAHLGAPRLAGLSDRYLLRQLEAFRAGWRGGDPEDVHGFQMRTMALAIGNEQAMRDVVVYIAELDGERPEEPTVQGNAQRGAELFELCTACHGDDGGGVAVIGAPQLAGQHDWYLLRQLQAFQQGHRGTQPEDLRGQQMRQIALTLHDPQALADVVAHIATLEAPDEQ